MRMLVVAIFIVLCGIGPLHAASSQQPACVYLGWIDAVRLGAGNRVAEDQRRGWMVRLFSGVELSQALALAEASLPPAESGQVKQLLTRANNLARGRKTGFDSLDLREIGASLGKIGCDKQKGVPFRGDSAIGAAQLLGSTLGAASSTFDGEKDWNLPDYIPAYAGIILILSGFAIFVIRKMIRKEQRARRYVCLLEVTLLLDDAQFPARILDVSQGGCRLQLTSGLQIGQSITILTGPFRISGRVAWSGGDTGGVAFGQVLTKKELSDLRDFAKRKARRARYRRADARRA